MEFLPDLAKEVVELLIDKGLKITAAESCTGGLFAKLITDVSGASQILEESHVTYSPRAKERILGVSAETIDKYGVVSSGVAYEMAEGAKRISGADISVAFTGYAGPDGDDVGLVYMGVSYKETQTFRLNLKGTRNEIRNAACMKGLLKIKEIAKGVSV